MRIDPQRGEIWMVDLDPTCGSQVQKIRPCVVIGSNDAPWLPLRIIVPFMDWKPQYTAWYWMIKVNPYPSNGLSGPSAADTFQIRTISVQRMQHKVGRLSHTSLQEIVTALAAVVEYTVDPPQAGGNEEKPLSV